MSTGGTLSSLFSILSLFTEDIKLAWTPPPSTPDEPADEDEYLEAIPIGRGREKTRTNSDVSHLDMDLTHRTVESPSELSPIPQTPVRMNRSLSVGTAEGTVRQHSTSSEGTAEESGSSSELPTRVLSPQARPARRKSTSFPASPRHPGRPDPSATIKKPTMHPLAGYGVQGRKKQASGPLGSAALSGTIARATVDSTLAVIPAEAFKKLTKKFPKASGTVVQVVLERFSRVTFMTGEPPT